LATTTGKLLLAVVRVRLWLVSRLIRERISNWRNPVITRIGHRVRCRVAPTGIINRPSERIVLWRLSRFRRSRVTRRRLRWLRKIRKIRTIRLVD